MLDGGGLYAFYGGQGNPPTGALTINDGAGCTVSRDVVLTLDNNSNPAVTQMRISEDPLFSSAVWQAYARVSNWTLSAGFSTKNVYAQLRDTNGLQSVVFTAQIDYLATCSTNLSPNLFKHNSLGQSNIVVVGQEFTYQITFDNYSNSVAAVSVSLVDQIPAGLDLVSITTNGVVSTSYDISNRTIVLNFGTWPALTAGPTNYLTVKVNASATGLIVNEARLVCRNLPPAVAQDQGVVVASSNRPPVVVCKSSITANTDAGLCSAMVAATNLDNGSYSPQGGPLTFTLTPPPPYPVGTNIVTFTATDAQGLSSSVSNVLIIVVDTQPPVLVCASNKVVECGTAWDFDPPFAFDNCTATNVAIVPITVVTNPGCGGTFTATMTWMAIDTFTNTATCSQTVTVVDTIPPTIVCPAPITVEFQDENGAVVHFTVTASDSCSPVSLVVSPPSGSVFPFGTTPVQAIAMDACYQQRELQLHGDSAGGAGGQIQRAGGVDRVARPGHDPAERQRHGVVELRHPEHDPVAANQPVAGPEAHGVRQTGGEVFDQEKNVVICLTNLIDWGGSGIPGPTLQNLVDRLVRADRLLAVVSIQEAVLAGVSPVIISNALVYVARGDEAAIGGQAGGPDPPVRSRGTRRRGR